jgi:uncharacterized protein (DUF433 family)
VSKELVAMKRRILGRYVFADPEICHGQPTFVGTRVRVTQILNALAEGMDWDTIIWQWHGSFSREAIAEALQLASQAVARQNHVPSRKPQSA